MDTEETKIAVLIVAFDTEHVRAQAAITTLKETGSVLKVEVASGAERAVTQALITLNADIEKASKTLLDLQSLSLRMALLQHVIVAVVAMMVTLLGVWWYVPSQSDIAARQAEVQELKATIDDLTKRGGKIPITTCGAKKRLCVWVDESAGAFGDGAETYRIAHGY